MGRRRGQRSGWLREEYGSWLLTWREDAIDAGGRLRRKRFTRKIAEARGRDRVSKREARRIAWEGYLATLDSVSRKPQTLATLKDFVDHQFMPEHVWSLREAGQRHYRAVLKHVIGDEKNPERFPPELAHYRLRDITTDDVRALIRHKYDTGLSVQYLKHIKNVLSAVYGHAEGKGWNLPIHWTKHVKLPEARLTRERRSLSFEQAGKVLPELRRPAFEMGLLSIGCSLNVSEMLGLRWGRMNLTPEHASVDSIAVRPFHLLVAEQWYRGVPGPPKETARCRQVPMPRSVVAALVTLKQNSRYTSPEDFVFAGKTGKPMSAESLAAKVLKPVGRRLGMPWLSWHVFRRTTATLCEAKGMPLSDRMSLMGHGSAEMTMRYTMSDPERTIDVLEQVMEEILRPKGVVQ